MKTDVRRDGARVWIEGTAGWFFWEKPSSVHAAQEAVMRAIGEDITYDYLLGVSSLAFRMQISRQGFCPSSPHSCCGYKCVARSTQALPWDVRVLEFRSEEEDKVQEARRAVVESIDRGIPVQYGNEEDGIIVGYQKGGDEWICYHPFRGGDGGVFVEAQWPWGVAVLTARKETSPPRRHLAIGALQQAVTMATAGETKGYLVGFEAWEEYIVRLRALEEVDEATRLGAALGNAWIYECLVRYRASAVRYLRDIAREFDSPAAEHLMNAAGLYEKMSSEVLSDPEHSPRAIAPYPRMLKSGGSWNTEMRQGQLNRLESALPLEREAIGEIRKALALVDQPAEQGAPADADSPRR